MAWVNRTTRDSNPIGNPFKVGDGGAAVGPGSYNVPSAFGRAAAPSYVPFASSSNRLPAPSRADGRTFGVGPGHYSVPASVGAPLKPGMETPFMSFADRFASQAKLAAPGPGAYNPPGELAADVRARAAVHKKAAHASAAAAGGSGGGGGAGGGGGGRGDPSGVSWMRVPTAPSIPTSAQSYGYEEGSGGALVQQARPDVGYSGKGGDTAGPGAYEPRDDVLAGRSRRAANFGRMRGGRTDFTKASGGAGPDAGLYQPVIAQEPPSPREGHFARPQATFASRTERTGGAPVLPNKADDPGPGAYAVHKMSVFSKKKVPARNQFFGSTSRRFGGSGSGRFNAGPGPGSYATLSGFQKKPSTAPASRRVGGRRRPGQENPGFASTSSRFNRRSIASGKVPDPGTYNLPTMAADLMKKRDSGRCGVFGTTTKRFYRPEEVAVSRLPGPGEYQTKRALDPSRGRTKPSSVFASTEKRFNKGFSSAGQAGPDPGSYDVTGKWRGPSFARRKDGTQGLISSGGNRFKYDFGATPGPGAYDPAAGPAPTVGVGAVVTTAPRFDASMPSRDPGPGQYNSDPAGGAMHKRTFNMTIAEEEQRGDRRR